MTTLTLDDILAKLLPNLSESEMAFAIAFVSAIRAQCEANNVPITAITVLRVKDVLMTELLAQQLERTVWKDGVQPEQSAPDKPGPQKIALHPGIEALGKCRDRLRKAMTELDRDLAPAASAASKKETKEERPKGIADWYMEEFAEFDGIIEETREEMRRREEALKNDPEAHARYLEELRLGAPIPPDQLQAVRNGSP